MKFIFKKKYGYNDSGAIVICNVEDSDGDIVDSISITIRENEKTPSFFGWKKEMKERIREDGFVFKGIFKAIKKCNDPFFTESENPHWM